MMSMIRSAARVCIVILAIVLPIPTAHAQPPATFAYVSATGNGNCTSATQPCSSLNQAINASIGGTGGNGQIICLSPVNLTALGQATLFTFASQTLTMDCPVGAYLTSMDWTTGATSSTTKLRNVTFTNLGPDSAINFFGNGTLILENCVFEEAGAIALDIEPNGPLNVVIRNSRISNSGSGILIKPAASGSVNATLDHVTITGNAGGGVKIDTTNGAVTLVVTDSVVSNNAGNGINAVGGVGGQNMVSIKNSVITKNGSAGVQANGANAGIMIATTLLDQNAAGALSVVNSGNLLTYGDNSIVGTQGSAFTGTAPLQ
jgi:hypothetical protein